MPQFWMITNRALMNGLPDKTRGPLTYWVSDAGPWMLSVTAAEIASRVQILAHCRGRSIPSPGAWEKRRPETCLLFHFMVTTMAGTMPHDATNKLQRFLQRAGCLGICISFDWPSLASVLDICRTGARARGAPNDLADVLSALYDWLLVKQADVAANPSAVARPRCQSLRIVWKLCFCKKPCSRPDPKEPAPHGQLDQSNAHGGGRCG